MRIVAGQWKGLRLASVGKGDEAARLRPTPDRVREALFSSLAARGLPGKDTRVLDLFAGTGALGLEALSRGAAAAVFVEQGRVGQRLIRENLRLAGAEAQVLSVDATRLPRTEDPGFDLVFADPPYGKGLATAALMSARQGGWLAPGAVVIVEEDGPFAPPPGFAVLDERRYGGTHLTLLEGPQAV